MAVYERNYHPYEGALTETWSRFLILPRYSFREVFKAKLFVGFFVLCFVLPLGLSLLIYLPHNLSFLEAIGITQESLPDFFRFDGSFFFLWFMVPQGFLSLLLVLAVGPPLVSADMRNNGLALYLSRPFSRKEYVLGKMAVLIILLSAITWVPGLFLFALQSYLAGWDWLRENWNVAFAVFLGSWIWTLILCLLTLALSAYLKWKPVIRIALFAVFFVATVVAETINAVFKTEWGNVIDIGEMIAMVWVQLFDIPNRVSLPAWAAWASLLTTCGICLWMLARKIRAYEVVR